MSDENSVHVVEDAFHRLQTPQQDNPLSDENLANAVQVAIRAGEPAIGRQVQLKVVDRHATLTGRVKDQAQRERVEAAVMSINGLEGLTSELVLDSATGRAELSEEFSRHRFAGRPAFFVTRYCGLEPSSMAAAIDSALDALDQRFAALGLARPAQVVIVYRNRLPESVVLDVGYILADPAPQVDHDQLAYGETPAGLMLAPRALPDTNRLFQLHDQLINRATAADIKPRNFAWQRFPFEQARDRQNRVATPLYVPIS